jgi:hypothetical protein
MVVYMRRTLSPLGSLHLGDAVQIPGRGWLSVRCLVQIGGAPAAVEAFAVCGELELLLLSSPGSSILTCYTPVDPVPAQVLSGKAVVEGRSRFWAPHLPGMGSAMGECHWRVVSLPGGGAPAVLVWRGEELTVFWATWQVDSSELDWEKMPRPEGHEIPVQRYTAVAVPDPLYVDPVMPGVPVSRPQAPAHSGR